jgi:hypothetical protein
MRVISLSILLILVLGASAVRRQTNYNSLKAWIAAKIEAAYEAGEPLPEIYTTAAFVGSEEIPAFVPLPKVYDVEAPLADIELDNGDTVVVQALASYQSDGESYVVVNTGGQNLTVEAEIIPTTVPLAPVLYEGKVYVAEVVSSYKATNGTNYIVADAGDGQQETVEAKLLTPGVAAN